MVTIQYSMGYYRLILLLFIAIVSPAHASLVSVVAKPIVARVVHQQVNTSAPITYENFTVDFIDKNPGRKYSLFAFAQKISDSSDSEKYKEVVVYLFKKHPDLFEIADGKLTALATPPHPIMNKEIALDTVKSAAMSGVFDSLKSRASQALFGVSKEVVLSQKETLELAKARAELIDFTKKGAPQESLSSYEKIIATKNGQYQDAALKKKLEQQDTSVKKIARDLATKIPVELGTVAITNAALQKVDEQCKKDPEYQKFTRNPWLVKLRAVMFAYVVRNYVVMPAWNLLVQGAGSLYPE